MKINNFKWLLFSTVLLFYALLYIATAKSTKCDEVCQKFDKVDSLLKKDAAVYGTWHCKTDVLCVYVNDSTSRNWNSVADTACLYMNNEGLLHYNVSIIGSFNRDTLLKQACP